MKNVYYKCLVVLFAVFCLSGEGYSQGSEFGIVLSGMEWGSGTGTVNSTYYLPTQAEFNYYSGLGFKVFRIPFLWERMQPTLGGTLDPTYLGYLDQVVGYATTAGVNVFIDCHNYARYPADPSTSSSSTVITQGGPTQAQFNNLWTQLATHYASNTTVWGYDIMNEPHDLGSANWPAIVQSVVSAIRTVDTKHTIIIEGDHWSQGHLWPTLPNSTGLAATTDPSNNLLFEAHQYFDSDESGTYASTSFSGNTPLGSANTVTSGVTLITPFVNWITTNKLRGMVGEYGIPNNASASDQTNWNSLLGNFLAYLQTNCILGTYWAGGPGWGNGYVASCEPLNNNYTTASDERPQMPTMATYTSFLSSCTPVGGGTPSPVTVSITSPSTAATLVVGNNITIQASASTTTGTISQVAFYEGGVLIGTATNSPYSVTWAPSTPGTYAVTAIATASGSQTATSSAVTITVLEPVYETTTAPVIDGVAEATWNNFPAVALNNVTIGTVSSSTYLSANWKATWDANNLYVLVTVTDDLLVNDNQAALYNDDGIEIYFDLGNTKTSTYGNNQFQYVFRWNDTKVYENIHNATTGVKMGQTNQGVTAGCTNNCAAQGYTIEVSIPWTTLTATAAPAIGSLEGFDVAVNDDDTGTRNAKIAWNMTSDNDYNDPANFGTVIMEGVNCTAPPATITPASATTFCEGGSVVLNANTGSGLTYQWNNAGTAISGATTASYTATTSAAYTVSVKNSTGCTATSSATTVTVNNPPTSVITATGPTTFNAGGSVVLNANTGTGITYQWYNNETSISGATAASYTATTAGTYTVSETVGTCPSVTSSGVVVTVRNVTVTITSPTNNTTTSGNVTLTATATANGSTITQVAFYANGTLVGTATTSPYTITWANPTGGSYQIIAIATDAKSEVDTSAAITLSIIPPVFNTATAPTIDGDVDPLWSNYQAYTLKNVVQGTVSSPTYLSANWKATWDATNFYVLVTVQDDMLVNTNQPQSGLYNDDGIEIYFDFGNTKTTTVGANQFQFAFRWNDPTIYELQHGATTGVKMGQTSQGITAGCTNNCAAIGYTIEVSIPWTTLTATKAPAIGTLEGFDVMVNDDDTGTRNAKISWNATSDNDYNNPSLFGTVIMEGAPCTLPTATINPATTATYCTGSSVTLTANTGTGFTYQWYEGVTAISGATSQTFAANAAASYTVAVKNSAGCTGTSTATAVTAVAVPTATITPVTTTTFCAGGSVVLNANTGTGLTYQWSNGGTAISGSTQASYTATTTGSYTVTVKNSSNCSATSAPTTVTVNALPTATITPATAASFCTGGNVTLNATTGTGLIYQWNNGGTAIVGATSSAYAAAAAGTYAVTVTNANNCSATSTGTVVTINPLPTATITPVTTTTFCAGGSVVLNANTGAGLTYQWSDGGTAISGATAGAYTTSTAGTYTVTVTNTNNCSATSAGTVVTVNALPTAAITPAGATTFCTGGNVVLNANTGAGLTYQWSNGGTAIGGATQASYTTNVTGSYTVAVKNTNCSATSAPATVTVEALPTAVITPATTTTFCTGGSVVLNANTGSGLTYQWSNGGNTISGATLASYTASAAGAYTVTVTNANNCSTTSTGTTVTVNPLPAATITPATTTTFCAGGSVVLNANTGPGLTYQWSNGGTAINGATLASYTTSTSGTYTVGVSNSNNCSATSTGTIVTVNALPIASITPSSSTNLCTGGSVVLNATAGAGLTYQWNNGGNIISGATNSAYTANTAGAYTVTVTNANNCEATSTGTTVAVNTLPTATITAATTTTFCLGGSVVLNANAGAGLTYQWNNGGAAISGATASGYTATVAGSYTVTVTNTNNCSTTSTGATVTVNALPTAVITPAGSISLCTGGSVVLNANTGTGFTYQWNDGGASISGATNSAFTVNATGTYTVVITNVNNCTAISTGVNVTVNSSPTANIVPATSTTFCAGGSVVLNANSGTGLTYQWNSGGNPINGATASSYTATTAGSYTVLVSFNNNCSATSAATNVVVNAIPAAPVVATPVTYCQGVSATALTATGSSLLWYALPSGGTGSVTAPIPSTSTAGASGYYVSQTINSCESPRAAIIVNINSQPTATITPASSTVLCTGGSVVLNANTGTGLTYQWNNGGTVISGATTSSYTASATGNYTVTETNTNNCSAISPATTVTVNATPTATITPASATTFCTGGSVVLNANSGAGLTYQWNNGGNPISGATMTTYTATAGGSYTVTVTSANCSATSTATVITVNTSPASTITAATATTICTGNNVVLNANTDTGINYQWNNGTAAISGATLASYTATTTGNYTVTITSANLCSVTSPTTSVTVNTPPTTSNAGSSQHITSTNTVLAANTPSSGIGSWTVISGTGTFANPSSPTTSVTGLGSGANVLQWAITSGACGSSVSTVTINVGTAPVKQTISGASKVISNQTGVTYAVTSNTGSTYHWSLPPGAVITSANSDSSQITINFGTSGGNVSVKETNAYGSATSSLAVTVGNTPTPEPISGPLGVTSGATGISYSVAVVSGYTYHWSLPTGVTITSASSDSNQITVSFGSSGGTIAVVETNTYGNATSSIQVAVGAAPAKQTISGLTLVLAGTTGVTYAVTPSSGSTFHWTLPPGAVIASASTDSSQITVNFGSTGGNVSVTQTNLFGSTTSSLAVNVGTAPVPQNISGPKFVTPGETGATYSVTSVVGVKNKWILPPGAIITSANSDSSQITVSYGTSGGSISITQTNSFGSTTSSLAISVGNAPPSLIITGPTTVTSGTAGVVYSIPPGTSVNTSWILPPGATITATNSDTTEIVVSFGSIGGNISVTQTNSYGSTISSIGVKVGSVPPPQTVTGPSSVTPSDSGVTYSVASHSGSTYQWSLPPGAKITSANADSSQITVTFGTTSGNLSVTETNSFGSTTNILPITIGQATGVVAAQAGDTYEVYPNPFLDNTTIVVTSAGSQKIALTVLNLQGITCYTTSEYYTNQQIRVGSQLSSAGIYFVQLSYGDVVKVIKVIKVD